MIPPKKQNTVLQEGRAQETAMRLPLFKLTSSSTWPIPIKLFRRPWLKNLASEVANLHTKKTMHILMSNWEASALNENQVEYAYIDAYSSYKIGHKLLVETGIMAS
ncbi:3'-5' exonuclease domain [Dillenia turbinata]|uniref:3'-5' exonuclease domain n=1 Tax=Dillenia turbinata TaxID=194707 RepID=A0AAN8Z1U5_9MAGN